MDRVFCCN